MQTKLRLLKEPLGSIRSLSAFAAGRKGVLEFRRFFGSSKFLVETPMRVKDAPLTLRRKLRTSFALSYQLLRLISICGLAAVSMAVRANSGLAFSAKPIGVALAQPLCRHRSLNRMRSSKFFEGPKLRRATVPLRYL